MSLASLAFLPYTCCSGYYRTWLHGPPLQAEAASLGNKMSIRDANAAKLKELAMQLSAAEAHIAEKTQALASANNEIRSLQQVCAMLKPALQLSCSCTTHRS